MTDQSILEDLLSRVVLWDVKNENTFLLIPCLYGIIEEEINYLKDHGYNATIETDWLIMVSRN